METIKIAALNKRLGIPRQVTLLFNLQEEVASYSFSLFSPISIELEESKMLEEILENLNEILENKSSSDLLI